MENKNDAANAIKLSIVEIDLTQSPTPRLPMDIPSLPPPPFDVSSLSVPSFNQVHTQEENQGTTSFFLPPPPFYRSENHSPIGAFLDEAKSMKDSFFEFLWASQQHMHGFASTAGGQTTCLRSLTSRT